jgi:ferric-dicitrate binding protein FerR (iron transport regulator)
MDAVTREFQRLTRLVLDDLATDSERAELARISAAQPELVAAVVDELTIDGLLKWRSGSITDPLPKVDLATPERRAWLARLTPRSIPLWTGALAATVLLALGYGAWFAAGVRAERAAVADIVEQEGVTWEEGATALLASGAVQPGRLSSTGGEYTLQFRDGPTIRVQGNSSLEIKSRMLVRLDHGRATAKVPENSIGFTIESALVDVVDQGTEFGISVGDGQADVVVFDGEVDVKPTHGQSPGQKRLTQGQAVGVGQAGFINRLTDVRRDVDGRWWRGDRPDDDDSVIASVSDNIGGSTDVYMCYQTTHHGLQDDAVAYSDNPNHQWNGLTPDGLPEFLRGADYIRTFNHYRYMKYFEMTVELHRPAILYVFADNRVPPPQWLTEGFEDTGVDIGLDEGPWLKDIPEEYREFDVNKTSFGAGKSIDNVFSVWRRECREEQSIQLGSAGEGIGEGETGRAMYGIAATPLASERSASSEVRE